METTSAAVDEYMAALDGDAHAVAQEVRQIIRRAAPGVSETLRYQMPCFAIDGQYLVYLGAWKKHLGLYPIPTLERELEHDLAPYRAAADTVRFPYRQAIPYDLIERLVAALVDRIRD